MIIKLSYNIGVLSLKEFFLGYSLKIINIKYYYN